ncbi:capsid protein [Folsomia candida]|uniref:Capsid protein n=1 Tax=Folsomia candida TaxID=158441 RepID=A0A226EPE3_FOLCA|nr:capsid protein [Folsomia candida]
MSERATFSASEQQPPPPLLLLAHSFLSFQSYRSVQNHLLPSLSLSSEVGLLSWCHRLIIEVDRRPSLFFDFSHFFPLEGKQCSFLQLLKMGKYNHRVTVSGLPFGSAFTLTVPGVGGGNRGGGGRRGGGKGGGKQKNKKNQRCWRCKEKGHFGNECNYTEEEAAAKKAEFFKKKEEKAATSTSAAAFKPPFAGWKPGFVMPTPPTNPNNIEMN